MFISYTYHPMHITHIHVFCVQFSSFIYFMYFICVYIPIPYLPPYPYCSTYIYCVHACILCIYIYCTHAYFARMFLFHTYPPIYIACSHIASAHPLIIIPVTYKYHDVYSILLYIPFFRKYIYIPYLSPYPYRAHPHHERPSIH